MLHAGKPLNKIELPYGQFGEKTLVYTYFLEIL